MILEYILLLIVLVLGIWLTYWCLRVWQFERYLKDIPHPPLIPLVGNAMEFASATTVLNNIVKYYKKYNGNFKIYVGSQPFIFFFETKDMEFILNSSTILRKSDAYRFIQNWLGTGLLTGWGNKWKKHRKIITPAFHFQILEESVNVFNSAVDILITKLSEESKKSSIDVYPFVARCALDIICETAMGTTVDAQNDLNSQYMESVNILSNVLIDRAFSPFLQNAFLYRLSGTYEKERQALKIVHGYARSAINKKMKEFGKPKEKEESPVDNLGIKKKKAFLDSLLEYAAKDPTFSFEDIRQEVDTFMFAGHDTTATSISFTLFSLAANPEVQVSISILKRTQALSKFPKTF
ncbi:cytochrome P450 [Oryctes borbonicus]|uniref:Cytochrome P450 n=1 Tax=Oryctes borbonicus TaxID=1629725 RepID=A0A0T6AWI3_9SCAR|nr:cytochrome P450 [Oryctes borbonicus]